MLAEMFDRLAQALNIVMGEKHLLEHYFYYRSMGKIFSQSSLDGCVIQYDSPSSFRAPNRNPHCSPQQAVPLSYFIDF